MKIRKGFVSNSSSSSFCCFGLYIDNNKDLEKIEKSVIKYFLNDIQINEFDDYPPYELTELVCDFFNTHDLVSCYEHLGCYIGFPPEISDDITLRTVKNNFISFFKEHFDINIDYESIRFMNMEF